MSEKSDAFFLKLQEEIQNDRLVLPTLPEVALRIREQVESQDCSAKDIAGLLAQDGALSAHFIRVANSPLYRAMDKLEDLQTIISRLGTRLVKDLVVSLAMKQIFMPTSSTRDKYFREAWSKSVEVAAICRMLATVVSGLNTEQALLAGLIHNIGVLPILVMAERDHIFTDGELEEVIYDLQGKVGGKVLESWDFPNYLVEVVTDCYKFDRHAENADYIDIVQVSLLQSGYFNGIVDEADYSQFPAYARLNMNPETYNIEAEERHEAIEETRQLLMG